MQASNRKNERKKKRSMGLNLLRKSMSFSSKHEVDVLVVLFDRASGAFQEFCSTDFSMFMEKMNAARYSGRDYTTYQLADLQEMMEDCQEVSPAPSKHLRMHSPVLSDTTSVDFRPPADLRNAPRERPRKPPASKPLGKDKEVAGFLAMIKPPSSKLTALTAPSISTEDTAEDIASPNKETLLQEKLLQEKLLEDEELSYSPSDFLLDP